MTTEFQEWLTNAETALADVLKECYGSRQLGAWQENHISTRALSAIGALGTNLSWPEAGCNVYWEAAKLSGRREQEYGDVAVFVRVWLTKLECVCGVAFYEAKRQYFKAERAEGFRSISLEQLGTIAANTPASRVLLYDFNPQDGAATATAVPTAFVEGLVKAKALSGAGRNLHGFGRAWHIDLADNFMGYGLDFRQEAVDTVMSSIKAGEPLVVIHAEVSRDPELVPELQKLPLAEYESWIELDSANRVEESAEPVPSQPPGRGMSM